MAQTGRRLTKEVLVELGRTLYEGMERADPSWPPEPWDGLSDDDRGFYANRVAELLKRPKLVEEALEGLRLENHIVRRPAEIGKELHIDSCIVFALKWQCANPKSV